MGGSSSNRRGSPSCRPRFRLAPAPQVLDFGNQRLGSRIVWAIKEREPGSSRPDVGLDLCMEQVEEEVEEEVEASPPPRRMPDLRRHKKLKALLLSKYDAVVAGTEACSWSVLDVEQYEETHAWNLCWSDVSVSLERVMRMGRLQKINHFPGMLELVRKAGTARNLNKMLKHVGKDYKFFPKTFMLPADYTELKQEFGDSGRGAKTFIVKPSKGCQGTGITLTRCLDDIDPHEPNIVQRYTSHRHPNPTSPIPSYPHP